MEEKELKDFALTEGEYNKYKDAEIKTSLEDLEKFDFSSDAQLNLDEYAEMVHLLELTQNPTEEKREALKAQDAENVILKEGEKFVGKEVVEQFEKERQRLKDFLRKYEVNTELVKNMSEPEKNKLYEIANFLFSNFQKLHNNLNIIFPLSIEEFKFVNEVITKKLDYDRDGCFQVKELKETYLNHYPKFIKSDVNVTDMGTIININTLMILYHHITRYKVKGAQTEFDLFISMVTKMEERLMLYNAYKILTERLSQEFVVWGGAISVDEESVVGNTGQPQTEVKDELKVVDEVTGKEK